MANEWIPISEKLPDEKGEYIVTYFPKHNDLIDTNTRRVGTDTFMGKYAWAKKKTQKVIAWMEKPEPYNN